MKKYTWLLGLTLTGLLTACGDNGSSDSPNKAIKPAPITADTISLALRIQGAEATQIDLPDSNNLTETTLTNVSRIVVTANSSFSFQLFTPKVEGKSVAGYLLELPDGSQQFIHTSTTAPQEAQVFSASSPTKSEKNKKPITYSATARIAENTTGHTTVLISGWNPELFDLNEQLENMAIRILPLLVNDTIANIAELTIAEILSADGFEISMVQNLLLAVEAVATSPVQITLTWDTETDVDLYVLEPDYAATQSRSDMLAFFNRLSGKSLGWLDKDNVTAYGPENITYQYQMPSGEYLIAVNYYHGAPETHYSVSIAIGNQKPVVLTGTFAAGTSNYGNFDNIDKETDNNSGTDIIYSFSVDDALNTQLQPRVPLAQYAGLWQLPADASAQGFVDIKSNGVTLYHTVQNPESIVCYKTRSFTLDYLPTGFRINAGLQMSDAFFAADGQSYTYKYLTLQQASAADFAPCLTPEESEE